ncbi:unnamed protein product [Meloidogyne enterolobii]|uniref:Uncharacterized protein n=1 Tax=Meloidogyne enterolobii TaxID=390850 RepID=A0ACB0Z019_MELEN
MLVRCLLPMQLDTGTGTRKSSTLCSLLLLVIATFFVLEVPGQSNNDGSVGVANHKLINNKVTLVNYTIEANEANFNSDEYRKRFPNACDVKIDSKTIEVRYDYNSTGCNVDLLSKNKGYNNKIKFTAGVRNKRMGLKCLDVGGSVQHSFNNIMPFVYSQNNEVIQELSKGSTKFNGNPNGGCKSGCGGKCLQWTPLEISWSKKGADVYAYTRLVGDAEPGIKQSRRLIKDEYILVFNMTLKSASEFTMEFDGQKTFNNHVDIACVLGGKPIAEPKTWTITDKDLKGEYLVFSLLPLNASVVFDGENLAGKPPPGPHCDLFIQFDRTYYELLFVSPPPQTTTTTTPTSNICPTEPAATTCAPCPLNPVQSPTPETSTSAVKNISSPSTKYPADSKYPEESKGWLFYLILVAAIIEGLIIIGILAWFARSWKKRKHSCEKECMTCTKYEQYLYGVYSAEPQVGEKIKTFAAWKEEVKKVGRFGVTIQLRSD